MAIIKGLVSALVASTTAKGKPQLGFTLTDAEGVETSCVVFTEERIATFAEVKDGDEIAVKGNRSNGRFAPEGTVIANELNPEMPEPKPFYEGAGLESGQIVVMTAGAFARKSVVGIATAMQDIDADTINDAHAEGVQLNVSWQEVLIDRGLIKACDFAELHTTRAYKDGDTKPGVQHYAEDRDGAREYMRKVGVAGYADAQKAEAEEANAS